MEHFSSLAKRLELFPSSLSYDKAGRSSRGDGSKKPCVITIVL
jgi:hypothetical protein